MCVCACVVCVSEFVWLLDAFVSGDQEDKGFKAEIGKAQKADTRICYSECRPQPSRTI